MATIGKMLEAEYELSTSPGRLVLFLFSDDLRMESLISKHRKHLRELYKHSISISLS